MIFQTELTTLDTELSQLQALLDAKRQQRSLFEELDAETNAAIEMVALLKTKIEAVSCDAIASLKTAVLQVFTDDGNQPIDPTPDPDDDEPELLCLNGDTGDYLLDDESTSIEPQEPLPCAACGADLRSESNYPQFMAAALAGICRDCEVKVIEAENKPHPHKEELNGQAYEWASPFASHLTCLLWDDAPLTGQKCDWASPFASPFACPIAPVHVPLPSSTEIVHTSARTGYLKLKTNGQILSSYAWFPRKDLAEAWFDWLDGMSLGLPELRLSQRNSSWKYEIKLTGLSMTQIERLSQEDLGRKPSKKKETPAQAAGIEPPSGWRQPQPKEDSPQLFAKVLLAESEYYRQTFPVSRVSANDIGYTVTLPNGDSRWYRADMVQIVDAEIEENALPAEPTIEFNDVVEVVADGNDTVGLVGTFGRVKVVKDDRIGVEIDEQLVYFKPSEVTVKAKAEVPQEQQQLQSGQTLLGSRTVTNGNYIGAARRTAIANARRGTADKIAALELMKAGLSPELAMAAAKGIDDASDF